VWPRASPRLRPAVPFSLSPKKLANFVYGNRMGNGPPATGNGRTFRRMGPPMLTGRAGYRRAGELTGQDFEVLPHLILQKRFGLQITRCRWEGEIPDEMLSDQVTLRRRYNGALLGLEHVQDLASKERQVLT
jgi:putative chitinase